MDRVPSQMGVTNLVYTIWSTQYLLFWLITWLTAFRAVATAGVGAIVKFAIHQNHYLGNFTFVHVRWNRNMGQMK